MNRIIFIVISLSFIIADTNINGDARIRPRLDIISHSSENATVDLYYLYRARLNISSDIGGGWFFKSKIGTNEIAGMTKMGEDNSNTVSNLDSSARPELSFINLYYGIKKDNFGFWGGVIPLNNNSGLDIHFYSDIMIDIPFLLYNNASTTGFSGYIYKLNWFISIDGNNTEIIQKEEGEDVNALDSFTAGIDFPMKWNNFLDIHPRALLSMNDSGDPGQMTFGLDMKFKEFFKINPVFSYHYSTQFVDKSNQYDISHLRMKLNIMRLTFWTDIAEYIDKSNNNAKSSLTYLWIDYNHDLFKSDRGSISIKPTIRYQMGALENPDFNRLKCELTTEIKFK